MKVIQQRTPEWFAARKNRVTGSVVGAILGLSPFTSRALVMRSMIWESLGLASEFEGNAATKWGTENEGGAIIEFEMETGLTVNPASFVPFEDWFGASPDGYVNGDCLIEVKCPFGLRDNPSPVFKSIAEQPHYAAQIQVQLHVTGRRACYFWQWAPHGRKLEIVERDDEWLAETMPILKTFHEQFLKELADNPDDYHRPPRFELDTPDAHKMVREYDELTEAIERMTERKKDLLEEMVAFMPEGRNGIIAGRKLTRIEKKGSVSYAKVVKEHCPKVDLEPYRGKPSSHWQLY